MIGPDWDALYHTPLQQLYLLWVVPLAFLAYRLVVPAPSGRAVVPEAASFVSIATVVFAFETLLDPLATGPGVRWAGIEGKAAASAVMFLFVYLGDFRVFLLAIGVARPEWSWTRKLRWAAVWCLTVPALAGLAYAGLRSLHPEIHGQWLWIVYEAGFLLLCVYFGRGWVASRLASEPGQAGFVRTLFGYSAAYYALWLTADLLIVVGGLDAGWALRMVPNQLYYGLWVVIVYRAFFSGPASKALRYEDASNSTQASR